MERDWRDLPTETCTRAVTPMENLRGTGSTTGSMAVFSREILSTDSERVRECGNDRPVKATVTTVSTETIKNGGLEFLHGPAVTSTGEITRQICVTDMDRCFGRTGVIIRESGSMVFSMAKVPICLSR